MTAPTVSPTDSRLQLVSLMVCGGRRAARGLPVKSMIFASKAKHHVTFHDEQERIV